MEEDFKGLSAGHDHLKHSPEGTLSDFEIIAISMQGIYFLGFVCPSMALLLKKWEHFDMYSRTMIILY